MTQRTCAIEGCPDPASTRGWCNGHYLRWRRYGDPEGGSYRLSRNGVCTVDDCEVPVLARGLCSAHYQRQRIKGDTGAAEIRQRAIGPCSFEGCEQKAEAKTLCASHRWQQRNGRPLTPLLRQTALTDRDANGQKYCGACREWKPVDDFGKVAARPDGRAHKCRRCVRSANLRTNFGITLEQYEKLLADQGHTCAICQAPSGKRALAVDHDHSCCPGKRGCPNCIRALLCQKCNLILGYVGDSPEHLRAAANYLERHKRR